MQVFAFSRIALKPLSGLTTRNSERTIVIERMTRPQKNDPTWSWEFLCFGSKKNDIQQAVVGSR
jgi:hypothetical protein